MDLIKKLHILMIRDNIKNTAQLSKVTNIPYTTLKSIFDGDVNDVRLSTSRKLCTYFNITLDDLLDDDIELSIDNVFSNELNKTIKKQYGESSVYLLNNYNKLNEIGRKKADAFVSDLTKITEYIEKKTNTKEA